MSDASEQATPNCHRCAKNPATVHVRRVTEGDEEGLHVCRECAMELGANPGTAEPEGLLSDPLALMLRSLEKDPQTGVCPGCGLDYEAFKKKGRLGCAQCWVIFSAQMESLILRLHGKTRHQGRSPAREGVQYEQASRIRRLNDELERAVGSEQYERAAELRDLLNDLIGAGKDAGHD